jgi:hypothetical protein
MFLPPMSACMVGVRVGVGLRVTVRGLGVRVMVRARVREG